MSCKRDNASGAFIEALIRTVSIEKPLLLLKKGAAREEQSRRSEEEI